MERSNIEVRASAQRARVAFWQVAERLGVSEATMTRMLRRELSAERRAEVLAAIEDIAAKRNKGASG